MYLFNNPTLFQKVIDDVSNSLNIEKKYIEKDYYLSLLLLEISRLSEDIAFKGGTSLSKAFNVIKRFSEDVDFAFMGHFEIAK